VLSRAQQATRRDLLNARYAREYAESGGRKGKGKGKAKQTKAAKGKGANRVTDGGTARLADGEVERQVEELMRLDEEEEEGGPPEAALVREEERFGVDEEDSPDTEYSADAVRRDPMHSCKGR
jgi:SOS response regulatory protein OraA/RecX